MKKVSLLLGIVLAIAAFAGVILLGQLMQPPTYDVAVAIKEVPPFTPLTADLVSIDTQSVSPAIAERYVQAAELDALLKSGAVVVENLRPGQPLLREAVASGTNAEKVSRLAVAVTDPNVVIVSVPVQPNNPLAQWHVAQLQQRYPGARVIAGTRPAAVELAGQLFLGVQTS